MPRASKPIKSIDGIVPRAPRQRSVYIDRHDIAPPKLMSLQPRRQRAMDVVKPVGHSPAPPITTKHQPLLRPVPLPAKPRPTYALPDADVVVRLSKTHSLRARLTSVVQYFILAGIALAAAYSTGVGQWFVLAYAVYALVFRKSSATSFAIALFILVAVPIFQLLGQTGIADNMAVYVYELLVVGTIQAIIELKWPPKSETIASK